MLSDRSYRTSELVVVLAGCMCKGDGCVASAQGNDVGEKNELEKDKQIICDSDEAYVPCMICV